MAVNGTKLPVSICAQDDRIATESGHQFIERKRPLLTLNGPSRDICAAPAKRNSGLPKPVAVKGVLACEWTSQCLIACVKEVQPRGLED